MEDEIIIDVDHLTKDYGFGRGVFDVSIKVKKGQCYGYLGPNGAGKSTTIRHIMGFSKTSVGSIKIFGKDSFSNTEEILKRVGYLPGEVALPEGLDGWGFLRMMQQMRNSYDEERLNYLLDLFKLDPAIDIKKASLGDKRKLAVVAAFMHDPDVLILDEPTSGLDPVMQHVFIDFVKEEKARGKTILLSSHIFSEVDATCDIISIIKDGKHVSTFNAKELKIKDEAIYILRFGDEESYDRFLLDNFFKIDFEDREHLKIGVSVPLTKYRSFFTGLTVYNILDFENKIFTLQDYFMSFYKEEKEFGGLTGIQGNEKGGKK